VPKRDSKGRFVKTKKKARKSRRRKRR